eukprot:412864_1
MSINNSQRSKRNRLMTILGMVCVGLAECLAAASDTITKVSLEKSNISQILITTNIIIVIPCLIWWKLFKHKQTGPWYGKKQYFAIIWLYGFCIFMDNVSVWYGQHFVPIGNSYVIITFADLIIVFISYVCLQEKLLKTFVPALILKT